MAKQWYEEIYLPVVTEIRNEDLLDDFPNRTEADLFLYATYHRIAKSRLTNEKVTYREALRDFRPSGKKTLKEKIFEVINSLLNLNENAHDCPQSLLIDEDGLVKVIPNCENCPKSSLGDTKYSEAKIVTDEDDLSKL